MLVVDGKLESTNRSWGQESPNKGDQVPKYDVKVQLSGNDGNAFSIMASVKNALKKAGAGKEEIDQYLSDSMAGDYDNLIQVATEWVEVA
jgi:hypothetical protein